MKKIDGRNIMYVHRGTNGKFYITPSEVKQSDEIGNGYPTIRLAVTYGYSLSNGVRTHYKYEGKLHKISI